MRDTIAWSYGLLSAPAQAMVRRVSAFNGGCTLDAIRAICGDDSLDVLQELWTLIGNSLIRRTDSVTGDSRYTVLEMVREFGLERLQQTDEASAVHQRHASYYLAFAEQVAARVDTVAQEEWLDRAEPEQGNLYSALEWAIDQRDAETALGLCGALLPLWQFRLHSSAGREWVRRALPLSGDISALVLRKAVFSAGMLAYLDGDHAGAESFFADALLRYRDADDPEMTGRVELALERLAWDEDDLDAARSWFDTAKLRFEACGDEVGLAHCLHFEGLVAFKDGDLPQAEVLLRNSLSRWQALGFTWELTQCIPGHLADVARVQGNLGEAMSRYQECLRLNWNRRYLEDVSWSLAGLALVAAAAVPATAATGMCR